MKTPYIVVLVTTANKQEAEKIVKTLLAAKLVACGNIISPVTSLFGWSGQIKKAEECLIVMKSRRDLFERISESVKALHSYEVPEILSFEVMDGSKNYLDWLESCLK